MTATARQQRTVNYAINHNHGRLLRNFASKLILYGCSGFGTFLIFYLITNYFGPQTNILLTIQGQIEFDFGFAGFLGCACTGVVLGLYGEREELLEEIVRNADGIRWGRIVSDSENSCKEKSLEAWYPLDADPILQNAGIEIGAVVTWGVHGIKNRIVFRLGKKTSSVNCVHLILDSIAADIIQDGGETTVQIEDFPDLDKYVEKSKHTLPNVTLPPETHFEALKMYVEGLALEGIANIWRESILAGESAIGFNDHMQIQIYNALTNLDKNVMQPMFTEILFYIADEDSQIAGKYIGEDFTFLMKNVKIPAQVISDLVSLHPDIIQPIIKALGEDEEEEYDPAELLQLIMANMGIVEDNSKLMMYRIFHMLPYLVGNTNEIENEGE